MYLDGVLGIGMMTNIDLTMIRRVMNTQWVESLVLLLIGGIRVCRGTLEGSRQDFLAVVGNLDDSMK